MTDPLLAVLLGLLQGVFEWLPISSEGNVTVLLAALGRPAETAVRLSLFLHVGTAVSATLYYRDRVVAVTRALPHWRPGTAFEAPTADLSFVAVGTLAAGVTGVAAYLALSSVVEALTGGAFVAAIGVALVATGVLQRTVADLELGQRTDPSLGDAVLTGGLQGLAILPGVSRSGVTISALLFRRHASRSAFDYSFLLSIPAALGAGALVVVDHGGLPDIAPSDAALALATSAVVGYLTIDALLALVERVRIWAVCVGLGALAIVGGLVIVVV
jgi:undecaprenyl-diphosphatase